MPISRLDSVISEGVGGPAPKPTPGQDAGFFDALRAAYKTESPIGALFDTEAGKSAGPYIDLDFDPFEGDRIKGYEQAADAFIYANNEDDVAQIKREVDRYRKHQKTIEAAGGWGVLAAFAAGVLSPTVFLPGGSIVQSARGGVSIGRTALSAAKWGALGAGIDEIALYQMQAAREPKEILYGTASGAALAGVLGAGVGTLARRLAKKRAGYETGDIHVDRRNAAAGDALQTRMVGRLTNAGVEEARARDYAATVAAFYRSMAARSGKTVDELLEEFPAPEVRAAEDVGGEFEAGRRSYAQSDARGPDAPETRRADADDGVDADGVRYEAGRAVTETPEFRAWFGDSKVVDESGVPLVVYHGTRAEFEAFEPNDMGLHFGSRPQADMRNSKRRVEVFLSIKNPKRVRDSDGNWKKAVKAAKSRGHDGLVYLNRYEGIPFERFEELRARGISDEKMNRMSDAQFRKLVPEASDSYVAFNPTQIKSVFNRGTFDPNDPRILAQSARGYIEMPLRPGEAPIITLMGKADASTFLHEAGHWFLDVMQRMARDPNAPADLKADVEAVRAWWRENAEAVAKDAGGGVTADDVRAVLDNGTTGDAAKDGRVVVGMQEQWARGFERFLMEGGPGPEAGVPTSPEMAGMFERFKQWLLDLYETATKLGVDISPEVRQVMSRMLTADRQAAWKDMTGEFATRLGDDAGAAAVLSSEPASEELVGRAARGVVASNRMMGDPVARLTLSPTLAARRLARRLVETSLQTRTDVDGVARSEIPVETLIRKWQGNLATGFRAVHLEFLKARGLGPEDLPTTDTGLEFAVAKRAIGDKIGRGGQAWTFRAFKEEVGRAMRVGGQHDDPNVAAAAKAMIEEVYQPLAREAVDLKLLPEEVVTGEDAVKYLNRVYATDRIVKQRPRFVSMVTEWLDQQREIKAGLQSEATDAVDLEQQSRNHLVRARARVTTAERAVANAEARIAEHAIAERRNASRLERLAERDAALQERIDELSAELDGLRREGTRNYREIAALQKEVAALERAKKKALPKDDGERREALDFIRGDERLRKAFEIISGRRKMPEPRTILHDMREIGVNDAGGEIARATGLKPQQFGGRRVGGLTTEDRLGEHLTSLGYPGVDPREVMDVRSAIIDMVQRTINGDLVVSPKADQGEVKLREYVLYLEEATARAGIDLSTPENFFRFVAGLDSDTPRPGQTMTLEDLEAELTEMDAVGAGPVEPVGPAAAVLRARKEARQELLSTISEASRTRKRGRAKQPAARAQTGERAMEARAQVSRGDVLGDRLVAAQDRLAAAEDAVAVAGADHWAARDRLERVVLRWEGDTSIAAKSAMKSRGDSQGVNGRKTSADAAVDAAIRKIIANTETRMDRQELMDIAEQIADRIVSTPDGRLPYDGRTSSGSADFAGVKAGGLRGPMQARVFAIPDDFEFDGIRFEDFLESDIEMVSSMYVRSMAPDVELAKRFGAPDPGSERWMETQIQEIRSEYSFLRRGVEDEGEQARLQRSMDNDIAALAGIRDRLRHTYAVRSNPQSWMLRAQDVVLMWNMMRLLGGMTVSAMPDAFRVVMHNGFSRAGLAAPMRSLVSNTDLRQSVRAELQAMGSGLDIMMSSRIMAIADFDLHYHRLSKFERGVQGAAAVFGKMSLMNYWNQAMKEFAGMVTVSRMTPAIRDLAAGKAAKADAAKLAQMGIDAPMADRMVREMDQHGRWLDGVFAPETLSWTDRGAAETLRAALVADVDQKIVTPGQERPLWMSRDGWRLVGQFRSFMVAAQQRVLASGLQQGDKYALMGLIGMTGLGVLSYYIKQTLAGRDVVDDWEVLLVEGLDRSGVTGWLFDVNNIAEKLTGGNVGLSQFTGKQVSRFASRNAVGAVLGPTFGTFQDATLAARSLLGPDEFTETDLRRIRTLMPAQNLFYFRTLWNAAEKSAAEGLNLAERAG